jgi:hypothetical protein
MVVSPWKVGPKFCGYSYVWLHLHEQRLCPGCGAGYRDVWVETHEDMGCMRCGWLGKLGPNGELGWSGLAASAPEAPAASAIAQESERYMFFGPAEPGGVIGRGLGRDSGDDPLAGPTHMARAG